MPLTPSGHACPFCGGSDLRSFNAFDYEVASRSVPVVECRSCETGWQWPLSHQHEESVAYFDSMYGAAAEGTYYDPAKRTALAEVEMGYVNSLARPGTLLDIGCGAGEFVSVAASHGWQATGIDPALPTTLKAGPARLIRGSFAELGGETFDVVTAWDVVEHVEDPGALLACARGSLRPGGTFVLETGNYQSAGRIESGPHWWGYNRDHRWYFSPPVLFRMLREAGFKEPKLHNRVLRPEWSGSPAYAGPSLLGTLRSALRRPHKAPEIAARYTALKRAASWKDWAGLQIVTISATA